MKKFTKGFTLIELLIVIALLGALAVALLAALDPLEQIKKGSDTGTRNTVAEIHGAMVRYSALRGGVMPFDTTGGGTQEFVAIGDDAASAQRKALQSVIDSGELKSDFTALAGEQLNKVFITGINASGNQAVNVCYAPTAKSFRLDVNTKFIEGDGSVTEAGAGECPSASGTVAGDAANNAGATCYWCVR